MLFRDISLIDRNMQVREHMFVGVQDDRITWLDAAPPADAEAYGESYDGRHKLLLPAFYDAHTHLPMTLLRGYGESLKLMDWLQGRIFPFEAKLREEDIYWSCLMGIAEMLRFGVVGATEMYMRGEAMGRAFVESGAKADFAVACSCMDEREYQQLPAAEEAWVTRQRFDGYDNGRIRVGYALHAEYTSTERVVRGLAAALAEQQGHIHVHVSETAGEVAECRERHQGQSPVQYLANCGLFDVPALAAHCVHIDAEDIAILRQYGVHVATCPKSNLKLASGVCPVPALLQAGVNVALATDSVASNNNLNMLEEMKFFALLHKGIALDPTLITPAETLYAATRAGALSQGREDSGFVELGFKADLAVLDTQQIYWQPAHDLLNNLVFSACGTDIVLTMADGRILYRDGHYPTLDMEKIGFELEAARRRILGELAAEQAGS